MRKLPIALASAVVLAAGTAQAAIHSFAAVLSGAEECATAGGPGACVTFGVGDPDGYGMATLVIDDLANTMAWSIIVANIDTVVDAHIHAGSSGVNGPVVQGFGTLIGAKPLDLTKAFPTPATAMDFYVNIHTQAFRPGAIRGQLMHVKTVSPPVPEPETYAMFAAGLAGIALMIRRRRGNR
jgi:hypothetical protein